MGCDYQGFMYTTVNTPGPGFSKKKPQQIKS